jgi:hypothetical protein
LLTIGGEVRDAMEMGKFSLSTVDNALRIPRDIDTPFNDEEYQQNLLEVYQAIPI